MHNFLQLLRPALRYRWTIGGVFLSSVMIGLLWGLNIGTLYPVLRIAFQRESLHGWVSEEVATATKSASELESQVAGSDEDAEKLKTAIKSARNKARFYSRLEPLARRMPRDPFYGIVAIVMALVAGTALKGIFIFSNLMLVARLENRVMFDLRRRFFHKCLKLDLGTFGEERSSGLMSQFHADVGLISAAIRALAGTALREPLKMLACLVGACWISPRLLLLSLIMTPITAFTIRKLAGSIKRANRRSLEEISSLFGVLSEAFNGIETVQAFTLERSQRRKFFGIAKSCMQKTMRIAFYNALTKPITELLGICVIAMALIAGAWLTLNQATHIGPIRILSSPMDMLQMLSFFGLLIGATEPARKLSDVFNAAQAGIAAADRLVPLLSQKPAIEDPAEPVELPTPMESIHFENVSFHYANNETPVLRNINLEIRAGETMAIVGPNGCGKTTLINLLPRFHDPVSGSVRMNGVELKDSRVRDLRQRIGMVTQRALLFDDTVHNNIQHGRLDASQTDIVRAAKAARADRFIVEQLEDGYNTVIGTGGSNLSGGQRQRLALARAMVRDPEILILDEATSQIDIESEQLIHQALEQFAADRTVIMITHRLSTLELADRIVVMDEGRITDVGTHDDLIVRCPLYQRLHEIQFKRSA